MLPRMDLFIFMLITILGYSAQQSVREKIATLYIRTVVRHTDVILDCPQQSAMQFEPVVKWFFSPIDQPSMKLIHNDRRFKPTSESNFSLLIRNVTIEEAGMFICCLNGSCMDILLVVLDFENILSFVPGDGNASGEIIVSSKGDLSITAHHSTDLNVTIFKEPNIAICDYFAGKAVCYKRKRKNSTTYHLKNVKLENSGQCEIKSSSNQLDASYRLNVLIQGQPVINMEINYSDDGIKFICHGKAFPPPVFEFCFVPAVMREEGSVTSIVLQSFNVSNHSVNVSATAETKHPISGPGTVECRANNSEGMAYAVIPLFLEHLIDENPVTSSRGTIKPRNEMQFIITSPVGAIKVGGTVLLQCKASFYVFSKRFVFLYEGVSFPIDGIEQNDSWVANFKLHASREELVICNAQSRNGSQISRKVMLPLELALIDEFYHETDQHRVSMKQIFKWFGYFIALTSLVGVFSSAIIVPLWIKLSKSSEIFNQPAVAENNGATDNNPVYIIRQTAVARSTNGAVEATHVQLGRVEVPDQ